MSWRGKAFLGTAAIATAIGGLQSASAQVMEISPSGSVTLYDGPTVFSADGATPIASPRRRDRSLPAAAPGTDRLSQAAAEAELSPDLVEAVGWRESHHQPAAVSRSGAIGEMQLMPRTAQALGVDPFDPQQNLLGGAAYLGALLRRYDGDLLRALAAYNAGPGAVDRYGGTPPYRETQAYVAAIMDRLSDKLSATPAGEGR